MTSRSRFLFRPALLGVWVGDEARDSDEEARRNGDDEAAREDEEGRDGEESRDDDGVEKGEMVGDEAAEQGDVEFRRLGRMVAKIEAGLGGTSSPGRTARCSATFDGDIKRTEESLFRRC